MMIMITIINNHHDQVCKDSLEKTNTKLFAGNPEQQADLCSFLCTPVPLYLLNKDFCNMHSIDIDVYGCFPKTLGLRNLTS